MQRKIFFQKCNFNYIFFVFYIIFFILNIFIGLDNNPGIFKKEGEEKIDYYLQLQILNLYIINLSYFLAVIPYLIRKRIIRKNEENIENNKTEYKKEKNDDLPLIYNDNQYIETEKKKKKYKILCIVVGALDFLQKIPFVLFNLLFKDRELIIYSFSCFTPFAIVIQFVCSYYILRIHFYKLQYLSLFLNMGIFIIILIIDIINSIKFGNADEPQFDPKSFYIYPFNIIFLSIELSYGKIIILEGFISVYLLMIIKGAVVLVFLIIFSLIILIVEKEIYSKMSIFFTDHIWILIINIFTHFLEDLFLWLIVDRFSPNYNPLAIIFQEVGFCILDRINGILKTNWDFCVRIILYIILTIGVIIHNEIVVINICDLGSDTKYFLDIKVEKEKLFEKADEPEDLKRFETFEEMELIDEENKDAIKDEEKTSSEN